jgi:hypothetical protein
VFLAFRVGSTVKLGVGVLGVILFTTHDSDKNKFYNQPSLEINEA